MLSITVAASFDGNSMIDSEESESSAIARLIDSPGPHASSNSDSIQFYLVRGTILIYTTKTHVPSKSIIVRYTGDVRRLDFQKCPWSSGDGERIIYGSRE